MIWHLLLLASIGISLCSATSEPPLTPGNHPERLQAQAAGPEPELRFPGLEGRLEPENPAIRLCAQRVDARIGVELEPSQRVWSASFEMTCVLDGRHSANLFAVPGLGEVTEVIDETGANVQRSYPQPAKLYYASFNSSASFRLDALLNKVPTTFHRVTGTLMVWEAVEVEDKSILLETLTPGLKIGTGLRLLDIGPLQGSQAIIAHVALDEVIPQDQLRVNPFLESSLLSPGENQLERGEGHLSVSKIEGGIAELRGHSIDLKGEPFKQWRVRWVAKAERRILKFSFTDIPCGQRPKP